jgi:hypothetical protein
MKSPPHFYRLHRYEGQMLYLKSASLGLVSTLIAFAIVSLLDYFVPASICGFNVDLESLLIEVTQQALNTNEENSSNLAWVIIITLATLAVAQLWVWFDVIVLCLLSKKYGVDASIIVMGRVLADSPLDALLYQSYISEEKVVMLTLSNRKMYVGVVNNMGEPNEIEGFDQEISLVPILSGYRDKDDLCVHWTTAYEDVDTDKDLRIVIRQELIESASEFDFNTWEAFVEQRKAKENKVKVTFNPQKNTFSWTLT